MFFLMIFFSSVSLTQYDIQPLRARCVLEMQRGINIENAAALMALSEFHSLDMLKGHALQFFNRFVSDY